MAPAGPSQNQSSQNLGAPSGTDTALLDLQLEPECSQLENTIKHYSKEVPASQLPFQKIFNNEIIRYLECQLIEIQEELSCQVVSVFLRNRNGEFVSAASYGFDSNRVELLSDRSSGIVAFKVKIEKLCGSIDSRSYPENHQEASPEEAVVYIFGNRDVSLDAHRFYMSNKLLEINKDLREINKRKNDALTTCIDDFLSKFKEKRDRNHFEAFQFLQNITHYLATGEHCGVVAVTLRLIKVDSSRLNESKLHTLFHTFSNGVSPKSDIAPRSLNGDEDKNSLVRKVFQTNSDYKDALQADIMLKDFISSNSSSYMEFINKDWVRANQIQGLYCCCLEPPEGSEAGRLGVITFYVGKGYPINKENFDYFKALAHKLSECIVLTFSSPDALVVKGYDVFSPFLSIVNGSDRPNAIDLKDLQIWLYYFSASGLKPDDISTSLTLSKPSDFYGFVRDLSAYGISDIEEKFLVALHMNSLPDIQALDQLDLFLANYPAYLETLRYLEGRLFNFISENSSSHSYDDPQLQELRQRLINYQIRCKEIYSMKLSTESVDVELIRVDGERNAYKEPHESSDEYDYGLLLGNFRGDSSYKVLSSRRVDISSLGDYVTIPESVYLSNRAYPYDPDYIVHAVVIKVSRRVFDKVTGAYKSTATSAVAISQEIAPLNHQ